MLYGSYFFWESIRSFREVAFLNWSRTHIFLKWYRIICLTLKRSLLSKLTVKKCRCKLRNIYSSFGIGSDHPWARFTWCISLSCRYKTILKSVIKYIYIFLSHAFTYRSYLMLSKLGIDLLGMHSPIGPCKKTKPDLAKERYFFFWHHIQISAVRLGSYMHIFFMSKK